jgi:hypothetical protein
MSPAEIRIFRERLESDPDNLQARRTFHEHYEWLESFWLDKYKNNHIPKFAREYNSYYWTLPDLIKSTRILSAYPPIGSSKLLDFDPTPTIKKATFYLKYHNDIFLPEYPEFENEKEIGSQWSATPLEAILAILEQIRNNLFHGKKMDLEPEKYTRNKELIANAVELTTILLDKLEEATFQIELS